MFKDREHPGDGPSLGQAPLRNALCPQSAELTLLLLQTALIIYLLCTILCDIYKQRWKVVMVQHAGIEV